MANWTVALTSCSERLKKVLDGVGFGDVGEAGEVGEVGEVGRVPSG
jgi:hypothetical protein